MTDLEARKLYTKLFPTSARYFTTAWDAVAKEMRAVVAAESDDEAVDVIFWWACWEGKSEAAERRDCRKWARRIRSEWRKMSGR